MSSAIKIFQGRFGRVALLDMSAPLVGHAHHHCHILLKAGGADSAFSVRGEVAPLTDDEVFEMGKGIADLLEPEPRPR